MQLDDALFVEAHQIFLRSRLIGFPDPIELGIDGLLGAGVKKA